MCEKHSDNRCRLNEACGALSQVPHPLMQTAGNTCQTLLRDDTSMSQKLASVALLALVFGA